MGKTKGGERKVTRYGLSGTRDRWRCLGSPVPGMRSQRFVDASPRNPYPVTYSATRYAPLGTRHAARGTRHAVLGTRYSKSRVHEAKRSKPETGNRLPNPSPWCAFDNVLTDDFNATVGPRLLPPLSFLHVDPSTEPCRSGRPRDPRAPAHGPPLCAGSLR